MRFLSSSGATLARANIRTQSLLICPWMDFATKLDAATPRMALTVAFASAKTHRTLIIIAAWRTDASENAASANLPLPR